MSGFSVQGGSATTLPTTASGQIPGESSPSVLNTASAEIDLSAEESTTTVARPLASDVQETEALGSGHAAQQQNRPHPLSPIMDTSPAASPGDSGIALPVKQNCSPAAVPSPPPLQPSASTTPTSTSRPTHAPRSPSSPTFTSPTHRSFGLASTSSTASTSTSASTSGPPSATGSRTRARPASVLVASLSQAGNSLQGIPKPRSNSSLQSSRPAPPSPANSRPPSQVLTFSPGVDSPQSSPRGSPAGHSHGPTSPPASASAMYQAANARGASPGQSGRDRAWSSSSGAGRRLRPKSTLGTSMVSGALFQDAVTSEPSSPVRKSGAGTLEPAAEVNLSTGKSDDDGDSTQPPNDVLMDTASGTTIAPRIRRVIVRDYAFPSTDARFDGLGPQRPYSNWGEGEPEPEKPKQPQPSGWGSLSFALGSWNFMRRGTEPEQPESDGPVEDLGTDHTNDDYWSDDQDDDNDDYYDDEQEPDGLFRAAYAFDPEGVNEMAIAVNDLLDVRGRGGGGDGWVVAIRLDTGEEGLVPEGYLERAAERNYPEEWAKVRAEREAMSVAAPGEVRSSQPERGNVLAQLVCATPAGISPESP